METKQSESHSPAWGILQVINILACGTIIFAGFSGHLESMGHTVTKVKVVQTTPENAVYERLDNGERFESRRVLGTNGEVFKANISEMTQKSRW